MRTLIAIVIAPASLVAVGLGLEMLQAPAVRPELAGLLDCEAEHAGGVPKGWNGGPPGTFAVDGVTVHAGKWALRIDRHEKSPAAFTAVSKTIPIDFAGATLPNYSKLCSTFNFFFLSLHTR